MANPEHIAIARQGKDAWNDWVQNLEAMADFSGEDLTEISFAGFEFPAPVDFSGSEFSLGADFSGVNFGNFANFSMVKFFDIAVFEGSKFSGMASFPGSEFHLDAIFSKVQFSGYAHFPRVVFSGRAIFTNVAFSKLANFGGVDFSTISDFSQSKFLDDVRFSDAEFRFDANFFKVDFLGRADFPESNFLSGANFSGGAFSGHTNFSGAIFRELADFSNRDFRCSADFRVRAFSQAPEFHNTSIHQGTKFGNIDDAFRGFESDGAEQSYRTLKLAMGQHQARTEEAAFAALELKARRYRLMREAKTKPFRKRPSLWSECLGYWLWEKCSKSGRGFLRPLSFYLVFWGAFAASYVLPCQGWRGDWWAGIHYAFLKQFPFAAAFRGGTNHFSNLENALFAATPLPGWVSALNSLQSLIALTLIFLMGLGIRHKFRLR